MTHQALVATLVLLLYALVAFLYIQNCTYLPYGHPPGQTPEETEQVKKALKRHGRGITPITTKTRIYFVRGRKEITILWRKG